MSKRILVVDDDQEICRLIKGYLEQAGYQVSVANDGEMALHAIRTERPDLIVLDLMLPGRNGWEITRIVREDHTLAQTPIIMLTARVDDTDRILGLELGADDYVTKPFNPREVVARARAVLRRASGDFTQPREFDLLQVLMENPGRAFTRSDLIEHGLGYTYEGLERTVDSHIKNLRRKLEADLRKPCYVQTVYGVGYRLVGDQPR